jgi:hypothetical protein
LAAGWVGGRSSSVRAQRRSIGVTRGHELERALEREALAAAAELHGETLRQGTIEPERSDQASKKDKNGKTGKEAEKRNKGGSRLLFWKKGKGETSKKDLHAVEVVAVVDSTTKAEEEEGGSNTAESAVAERERSGTLDFYAVMGSGYHKQHTVAQT